MKVGLIAVGTELLWGNKWDSNKSELALSLSNFGLDIDCELIIKDDIGDFIKTLNFLKDSDLIIISGGLGPTRDDITREGLSKYFKCKLKFEEKLWDEMKKNYEKRGFKLKEAAKNQFYLPSCSKLLKNEKGTAPGILISKKGKVVMAFPGAPEEFKFMVSKYLLPYLKRKKIKKIFKKTFNLSGTFESYVEDKLKRFYEKFPEKELTILASYGIVSITIKDENKNFFEKMEKEIKKIFGDEIFSTDEKKLNEVVFDLLSEKNKKISIAESCTGGGLSFDLVKVPGISKFLKGSIVVYSNEAKENLLGVSKKSLKKYGAVSMEVAKEMALNVREKFKSDIGVSITGIAGPQGGSEEKPVGTVFIGICTDKIADIQKFHFTGSRQRIQNFTINFALNLIRKALL